MRPSDHTPANPYERSPLVAVEVDPATGRHVRAVVFAGDAPPAVLAAARRARAKSSDPRLPEWNATDASTLASFYGKSFARTLAGRDPATWFAGADRAGASPGAPTIGMLAVDRVTRGAQAIADDGGALRPAPRAAATGYIAMRAAPARAGVLGGARRGALALGAPTAADFGDLSIFDRGEQDDGDSQRSQADPDSPVDSRDAHAPPRVVAPGGDMPRGAREPAPAPPLPGLPTFSELGTYPEDTVWDVREKIVAATGVPLFRLAILAAGTDAVPAPTSLATLDGAPVPLDFRRARTGGAGGGAGVGIAGVAGVAVSVELEARRGALLVDERETTTQLCPAGVASGGAPVAAPRVAYVFFVDLHRAMPPGAPGLAAALGDRHASDLLYCGAVLPHWPVLASAAAAALALGAAARMAAEFPALDPSPNALRARWVAAGHIARQAAAGTGAGSALAVVAAAARAMAPPRTRLGVRAVFDALPLGPARPAAAALFRVDGETLAAAGALPPGARRGEVPVAATRRHASSFAARGAAAAATEFFEHPPARPGVAFLVARVGGHAGAWASAFARVAIGADGAVEAAAEWREEARVAPAAAAAELAAEAGALAAEASALGAAALPAGGSLPLGGSAGAALGAGALAELTAAFYFASTAGVRAAREAFVGLESAGFVAIRGVPVAGGFASAWRRGALPPAGAGLRAEGGRGRAEGIPASGFARLVDAAAAARWGALAGGRVLRISQRTEDVRFEIAAAASHAEAEAARRYVVGALAAAAAAAGQSGARARARAAHPTDESARLRRLQERDPVLFDLRQYDPAAVVYSRLCQADRQPTPYSAAAAATLPAAARARLLRYWNFTERAPVYYGCPSADYPAPALRADGHPRGLCLPCCKKAAPPPSSRAGRAQAACAAAVASLRAGELPGQADPADPAAATDPSNPADAVDTGASRHVLAYGKALDPGRLGELHPDAAEGLLLAVVSPSGAKGPPYGAFAVGVPQSAPGVPEAGFAFALAFALAIGDDTPADVLEDLAGAAADFGPTFVALGGGAGATFESPAALADEIRRAFVRGDAGLGPFGPGGAAADSWPAILADLARHAYGTEVVTMAERGSADQPELPGPADSDGDAGRGAAGPGPLILEASAAAVAALAPSRTKRPTATRLAVLEMSPAAGTYPVAVLAPRFFMRTPPTLRWMAARRTFGADGDSAGDSALVTGGAARHSGSGSCPSCGGANGPAEGLAAALVTANVNDDYVPSLRAAIAAERAAPRRRRGRPRTRFPTGETANREPNSDSDSDSSSDSDTGSGTGSGDAAGPLRDEVFARIVAALEWGRDETAADTVTLDDIDRLVARRSYRLAARLVDASDRVYGVALAQGAAPQAVAPADWSGCVYLPVTRGAYPVDGVPAVFGARPAGLADATTVAALADALAALAAARPRGTPPVRPVATLAASGSIVGFVAGRLHYWHTPAAAPSVATEAARAGVAEWASALPVVDIPLDPRLVDEALVDLAAGAPAADAPRRAALAAEARAPERAFRGYVADFAARARSFRDDATRARLAAEITAVDFADETSAAGLRTRLAVALADATADSADLDAYMSIVAAAYSDAAGAARPGEVAAAAIAAADRARFDFDRKAFARVRAAGSATRRAAAAQVAELVDAAPRTSVSADDTAAARYRAAHASEFADALAGLILAGGFDEVIAAALPPAGAGVLTELDFTERPGERVEWRLLRE